jgi:hypothetical protein
MSADPIDHLAGLQDTIHGAHGVWGAAALARASAEAAAVPGFGGRPEVLQSISDELNEAARMVSGLQPALKSIQALNVDGVWAGAAHNSAADALSALLTDVTRLHAGLNQIVTHLRDHAVTMADALRSDQNGAEGLAEVASVVGPMARGQVPNPFAYDGAEMRAAHHDAMATVDLRLAAHIAMRNAAEDYTATMHDLAGQARGWKLDETRPGTGLTSIDAIVLAEAGSQYGGESPILTAAMDTRAADALAAMGDGERGQMMALLAAAQSPEQRAYLLKALAAGYPVDKVSQFNKMIGGHGTDAFWLDQHLSPLQMDGTPKAGRQPALFGLAGWDQGNHPTCVAASTIAARAEIDPLYALQLTTGGHPEDPAADTPQAFTERLRDEQTRVYDDGRGWWQPLIGDEGMTDHQSETVANEQIAPHTGVRYDNVGIGDEQDRASTLPSVERAVDDGYPVPLTTREGDEGHQMVVIGHSGDQLQIYNPWGYTFWVTEDEFVSGHVDGVDPDIPRAPISVRLPAGSR